MANTAYSYLPSGIRSRSDQAVLWRAITAAADYAATEYRNKLERFSTVVLSPLTADEDYLDFLSLITPWRLLWDTSWSVEVKRSLLAGTVHFFNRRGDLAILPELFQIFGLDAKLEPLSGWILGVSTIPATLGASIFSYRITVPSFYTPGSLERSRVEWILREFGAPIDVAIIYRS